MSQIIRAARIGVMMFSLAVMLTACGTSKPNNDNAFTKEEGHSASDEGSSLGESAELILHAADARANLNSCKECHGQDLSGGISRVACSSCHINGITEMSGCVSCHASPPSGTTAPNRAGAHTKHNALSNVTNVCDTCHSGAGSGTINHYDGVTEIAFLSNYNAKSGTAVGNADGTCSKVSCHGGQTTPVWLSGTIDVSTQCLNCHATGTTEYNSLSSGQHFFHVVTGGWEGDCWRCHDYTKLADIHFASLNTTTLDGQAYTTLNSNINYVKAAGTCDNVCHPGLRSW